MEKDKTNERKEIKNCKYCRTEIDKKAKICPNCHKKQGSRLLSIIIALAIIFGVIFLFISSCTKNVDDAIKENENSYLDINGKKSFKLNETFENKYIKMTMTEVNSDFKEYSEYFKPKSGNKVIMTKFEVENIGENDQVIGTFDFNGYADDSAVEKFYSADDKYTELSATISKGKKASGYVFIEVPKDSKKITLEYDANWLDNNNIVFVISE